VLNPTALEAFPRQPVARLSVCYSVCDLLSVQIRETVVVIVITNCKNPINPNTNPNLVYSH
jgi:hypothetical protein